MAVVALLRRRRKRGEYQANKNPGSQAAGV